MDFLSLPDLEVNVQKILQAKQTILNLSYLQNQQQITNPTTKTLQIVNIMLRLYQQLTHFFEQQIIKNNFLTLNIPPTIAISKYETVQSPNIIRLVQQNNQQQFEPSKIIRTKSQHFILSLKNQFKNNNPLLYNLSQKCKNYLQISVSQYSNILEQNKSINNSYQYQNKSLLQIVQKQKLNVSKQSIKQIELMKKNQSLSLLIKDMQKLLQQSVSLEEVSLMKDQIKIYKIKNDQIEKKLYNIEKQLRKQILQNNKAQKVIEQLNDQINKLRDVNEELSRLQDNIQFNDVLHQQNLAILKENYKLSRKIYELQLQQKSNKIKNYSSMKIIKNQKLKQSVLKTEETLISQNMIQSKWIDTSDDKSLDESNKTKQISKAQKLKPFNRIKKITASLPPICHKLNRSTQFKSQKKMTNMQQTKQQIKPQQKYIKLKDFINKDGIQHSHILSLLLKIISQSKQMLKKGQLKTLSPSSILISQSIQNTQQIKIVFQTNDLSVSQLQQLQMYESPETLINGTDNSECSLVWNIGTIMHYLMTKRSYFRQSSDVLVFKYVELDQDIQEQIRDLIRYSLVRNIDSRITIGQLQAGVNEQIRKLIYV